MEVLVAYASKHGSTEGIARAIAGRLTERGHRAHAANVAELDGPGTAAAVVLGSAVYAGSWMKEATAWAERHAQELARLPVWLFTSGPLGTDVEDEEEQPKQLPGLTETLHPVEHRVFFGALDRDGLGFAERMIVKAVRAPDGDFRDWEAIGAWADAIAARLDRA
jgi:menaquinone-dependent protoporphyrinogen oxidase